MWDPDSIGTLVTIATIALVAGFVHSAIGFGYGIVALAAIPFVLDIKTSHIVISLASVPMLMMATWTYRRGADKRSLLVASVGALVFLPLGLWAFESVSQDLLARSTGVAIIATVWFAMRKRDSTEATGVNDGACFAAGGLSGFLAGAVSIAGPPVAAFGLQQNWTPARYKAFVTQCLLVIAIFKAALLWHRDLIETEAHFFTLVAGVASIAGVQLGAAASRKIPAERFKKVVAISLVIVSILMILRGAA